MTSIYTSCLGPDHYSIYFDMAILDRTIDVVVRTQLKTEFKNRIDEIDPHPNPQRANWMDQPNPTSDPSEMMDCINILLATLPNHSTDPIYAVEESVDVPVVYCISGTVRICYHYFALAKVEISPAPDDYSFIEATVNQKLYKAPLLMGYKYSTVIWP